MPMSLPNQFYSPDEAWSYTYDGYDSKEEGRREVLCALGNGYFVTRSTTPGAIADDVHYPGTYRAGLYNRLSSQVNGETVEDESLVNLPDWSSLTFRIDGGDWFAIDAVELLTYRQVLQLRPGLLQREIRFCDRQGRQTTLREQRFVSMAQPHLAGLHLELTAENWSGNLEIRVAIDGRVTNSHVERDAPFSKQHLQPLATGRLEPEGVWLTTQTCQSQIEIAIATRTRITLDEPGIAGNEIEVVRTYESNNDQIAEYLQTSVQQGTTVAIEKIAALYTSRDPAIIECLTAAQQAVQRTANFAELFAAHQRSWSRLWQRCDLDLAPVKYLEAARLHIFHLLQTVSPHTSDLDVGIPARGWHGEDYRGHIFWDETFVLSFLSSRFPAIVRSLLLYRYRRLDTARQLAQQHGYQGAMFPWRSASTGREETPQLQFSPLTKLFRQDHTNRQRHIGSIIAYSVWQYYLTADDHVFLSDWGAELLIEIARFWVSLATYNSERDRYEIRGVVGPDEYHTRYPESDTPGIDNNTYTNLMVVWTICRAQEALDRLSPSRRTELSQVLALNPKELEQWDRVSRKMYIHFHADGILSQYEGFERLLPFDLDQFREQHGKQSVEEVLQGEGDDVNRYQVSKQADVAVLFFLLGENELTALLERLGYSLSREQMQRTIAHHLEHTAHASSLSHLIYTGATMTLDCETSWQLFTQVLFTDCSDGGGSSTKTGIHLGAMAGTLHLLHHCYLGLRTCEKVLYLDSALPSQLEYLRVSLNHQNNDLTIKITSDRLKITAAPENRDTVEMICQGQSLMVEPGAAIAIDLHPANE